MLLLKWTIKFLNWIEFSAGNVAMYDMDARSVHSSERVHYA